MTVVARRVRSTPIRTGVETWQFVVDLVASKSDDARRELLAVEGVAACLIVDEVPKEAPIVVAGSGPRLRVYCLYDDEAIGGESASEESLSWDPTEKDWQVFLPVSREEMSWVSASLKKLGSRVVAYDRDADERAGESSAERGAEFRVDVEAFKRP